MKHEYKIQCVVFSADGTRIATAGWDKTARLWDIATGRPLGQPMKHDREVCCMALSPNGTRIATASPDKPTGTGWDIRTRSWTVRLWDATTGKPLGPPMKHDGFNGPMVMVFSPDGTRIAIADCSMALLWDARTGKLIEVNTNDFWVDRVAFSPDSTRIVTAARDGAARLWDAATGKPLGQPMQHGDVDVGDSGEQPPSFFTCVAFSPDGTRIATAARDGGCACGTPQRASRSASQCRTNTRSSAWPSVRTARASPPLLARRRACGTPQRASRSASR